MKMLRVFFILISLYYVSSVYDKDWFVHKSKYNLRFDTASEERNKMKNFITNKNFIDKHNAYHKSFKLKENSRIHYSPSQFKENFLSKLNVESHMKQNRLSVKKSRNPIFKHRVNKIISHINWVEKGVAGTVKNQMNCGSCYAFATSNSITSAYAIKNNQTIELSKQQIIDCTRDSIYENHGCDGGYLDTSFNYAKEVGLVKDSFYPYTNKVSKCKMTDTFIKKQEVYKIKSFNQTNYFDTNDMQEVLLKGPAVAYIAASNSNFIMYGSGIYDDQNCVKDPFDHVVLVVGYGTDVKTKQDYWLVKNTWGEDWGEKGYVRILRNKNICGLETVFLYPIV